MTAYEVWKESKQRTRIPQRTVYEKLRWLKEQDYVVEIQGKLFKRMYKRNIRKIYYDVSLKGMLAALGDEKLSLKGAFFERLRSTLHIPPKYEKAVKPIVSIWAYRESGVPRSERRKIETEFIFMSVMETIAASKDIGVYSIIRKELKLPPINELMKRLHITDEDSRALDSFLSMLFLFKFPQTFEFHKRTLPYASALAPIPWLADCIEILPDVGIRIVWAPSKWETRTDGDYTFWVLLHRDIAELISKGDREGLDRLLCDFLSKLVVNWLPMCFRLELDGICTVNNKECAFPYPLECDIVRKHAENFKRYLDYVIQTCKKRQKIRENVM